MKVCEATNAELETMPQRVWSVSGCSVPGTSHQRSGVMCQDTCGWFTAGEIVVVAVADGAGSARLAHVGSATLIREAITPIIIQYLSGIDFGNGDLSAALRQSLLAAVKGLEAEAHNWGAEPGDLAATLILVVAGSDFIGAAQIGDGAAIICDGQSNLEALTIPKSGEFLNETSFLISAGAVDGAQIAVRRIRPVHFAVFTDGLQMLALKYPSGQPHGRFFLPVFEYLRHTPESEVAEGIGQFLKSRRIAERTDDDLTLVVAHLPS